MTNKIQQQTEALSNQFKKLEATKTDEEYLKELETYNRMLKSADLSLKSQAASKKSELKWYDKVLAPAVNGVTKQVNKVNKKL